VKPSPTLSAVDDLLLNSPVKSVQAHDTKLGVDGSVATNSQSEINQIRNVLAENGSFEEEKGLDGVKEVATVFFILGLNRTTGYTEDAWEKPLDGPLWEAIR
jgi:hypothetical protein